MDPSFRKLEACNWKLDLISNFRLPEVGSWARGSLFGLLAFPFPATKSMFRRPAASILFPRQNASNNVKKRLLSGRGTGSNKKAVKTVGTREGPRLEIGLFSFLSRYSFPATGEGRRSKSFFVIFVRWGFFSVFSKKRRILVAKRLFLKTPPVCRFPAHHSLVLR